MENTRYDLAVVGAGILGLAHALAAVRLGKKVVVIDRDAAANGASIRNFGFVTVTGQQAGDCWQMAARSRKVWGDIARDAGIPILQEGLTVAASHAESEAVIDAFLKTDMGRGCSKLTVQEAAERVPHLRKGTIKAGLYSPHEVRVESKEALPRLAAWLEEVHGADFLWQTSVLAVETPRLVTSRGDVKADAVVVCPGDDSISLFADRLADYNITRCKLQMLRVQPKTAISLGTAVMSDLGLARYLGYSELPESAPLKDLLDRVQGQERANGVHLIVVQSADGSLVVGDSHHYGPTPDPFGARSVDDLILGEMERVLDFGDYDVTERWIGTYATAPDRWRLTDAPDPATRVVVVTAGCGASTAFGIGEETINSLFG